MALIGTISGSVGSGGALRSATAITGTLVVANTSTSFPQIPIDPADAVLYAQGSIIASNEIHASGNLRLMNSSGDEGGEIFLNKSVTNTTLNGGVTIDVFQNRLRFFEQGGAARGYYLDISNGGGGVATNLGASSASPGGSDTYVQFNDAGSFGGQNTFKFNKTTGEVTVNRLFVTGVVGGSIVTSGALQVKDSGGTIVVNASELGTISGSSNLQIGGNITGSNALVNGDLAVNGGDITTSATTFNLIVDTATTVNFAGAATTLRIASGSGTAVSIGSSSGRTTIFNDLVLGTGNVVVTNDATPISLISSGNIIAKLDTNNDATGHKFAIQDWRNIDQFSVNESGNADISGSLVISGTTNMGTTIERMSHYQTTGSVIAFDMTFTSVFYVNNPNNDITANFTSLSSVVNNRVVTPTVILSQSATQKTITAVQIDGALQTIKWANGVTPTASANKQEVFGFSLIRSGSNWNVLGQMTSYG